MVHMLFTVVDVVVNVVIALGKVNWCKVQCLQYGQVVGEMCIYNNSKENTNNKWLKETEYVKGYLVFDI